MKLRAALFLALSVLGLTAEARVFDFNSSWVAAYIRGTGGTSVLDDRAYRNTSGTSTEFVAPEDYVFSGEIGFAFILNENINIRVGAEGVQGRHDDNVGTKVGTGAWLMDVSSQVTAFNPVVTFEGNFTNSGTGRIFAFVGAGYTSLKVGNDYTYSTAAQTLYGMPATLKEDWSGTGISYQAGLGFEIFLFDNATLSLEGGYRQLEVDKLTYTDTAQVLRGSSVFAATAGDTVYDNVDKKMEMHMSGPFVGVIFRFYIPPLN